jgi:SAM-dependent methyltransferase
MSTPPEIGKVACRACGAIGLERILWLGHTPLADRLVDPARAPEEDPTAPLDLVICPRCALVQITETVPPEILFSESYPYLASVSRTRMTLAEELARQLLERAGLGPEHLVVEPGSNDGYLLGFLAEAGVRVLGVDPAPQPAQEAQRRGVPTRCAFFGEALARELRAEGLEADVVVANNVLAHVADTNGFLRGVTQLLKPEGLFVAEVGYVGDLVRLRAFDTIYHQHLCYFSATSLRHLVARHGLALWDVERLPAQGGSLRIWARREAEPTERLRSLLEEERVRGLDRPEGYAEFARAVTALREEVRDLLLGLKRRGARIAGYGAAAKATTFLAYMGLGRDVLDYVVDLNPYKQGKMLPGVRLPIHPPERLRRDPPDVLLLLAWNYEKEVARQEAAYLREGGRLLVPIPRPRFVTAAEQPTS